MLFMYSYRGTFLSKKFLLHPFKKLLKYGAFGASVGVVTRGNFFSKFPGSPSKIFTLKNFKQT